MTKPAGKGKRSIKRIDYFKDASGSFVDAMEAGNAPWDKEFTPAPRNTMKNRQYNGVNFVTLLATKHSDPRWVSFNQAKELGWKMKKGAKSSRVYFYTQIDATPEEKEDEKVANENADLQVRQRPYLRAFPVFNAEDFDNVPSLETVRIENVDVFAIAHGMGITVDYAPDSALKLSETGIVLDDNFKTEDAHDAALLAGIAYWAVSREENRTGLALPSPQDVNPAMFDAMLRLRAQLSAIMLSSEYGLPIHKLATAEDTANWGRVLREDKKALFTASRDAWRVCDLVSQNAPLPDFMLDNDGSADSLPDTLFDDAELVPERRAKAAP